ncbi:restriction endonuclease subunit S [Canibacter zhoujuaniae]|uniref:restriction endonuclease subunit S n=1 Tax=Canibacter zhoujuaniae TaxID=2708343 RepID=UPI00141E785A|nr:restriction endonuclease subunit S [Canibacter zhoujuaniae]
MPHLEDKEVWFGELPEGWSAIRIKRLADINNGLTYSPENLSDHGTPVLRSNNIRNGKLDKTDLIYVDLDIPDKAKAARGDVLICSANGSKKLIGKSAVIDEDGMAFGAFMMIARPYCNSRYFYYLLNSDLFNYYLPTYLTTTINQLTVSNFGNMIVPFSDDATMQQLIADYLDDKTGEVDGVVGKLRRQVELLERYRRELIAHTVTRGLDPHAPMKDSGIEWLPSVPSHWEVAPGKRVFIKLQRPVKDGAETVTCFRDGTVTLRRNRRIDGFTESLQEIGYQGVEIGDLVIHEMDAFAGAIGVSDSSGKSTPVYSVCSMQGEGSPHFFAYLLRYMARSGFIESLARGIRQRTVDFRFKTLATLLVAIPPYEEQRQIAAYLDRKTRDIDSAVAGIKRQIELLGDYRKQVINDAVTGKIRVGEVA